MSSEARSVAELIASGEPQKYLYFWGHTPLKDGGVGKPCLSQWYAGHDFTVDGVTYRTAEHFMMAAKARLFGDEETAARIVATDHPNAVKKLGREIRNFDEDTWLAHRFDIVVAGSTAKFGQYDQLQKFLLGTGSLILVEASPVDKIWGIGLSADDDRAADPQNWLGLNLLGFALMEARARLR